MNEKIELEARLEELREQNHGLSNLLEYGGELADKVAKLLKRKEEQGYLSAEDQKAIDDAVEAWDLWVDFEAIIAYDWPEEDGAKIIANKDGVPCEEVYDYNPATGDQSLPRIYRRQPDGTYAYTY